MIDIDTRLRVARGIAKNETQASVEVFQTLKRRGHPDGPPPTASDGWGGIDEAQYLQVVKLRDNGRVVGTDLRVIYGDPEDVLDLLGQSTSYVERTHLTMRHFNSRLGRRSLAFSKQIELYRASAAWEDACYNWVRPVKTLRQEVFDDPSCRWLPRTPAMASELTNHTWTIKELLLTIIPPLYSNS